MSSSARSGETQNVLISTIEESFDPMVAITKVSVWADAIPRRQVVPLCSFSIVNRYHVTRVPLAGHPVPLGKPFTPITPKPEMRPAWIACKIIPALCETLGSTAMRKSYYAARYSTVMIVVCYID
jgi:hypothetical protein